MDLIILLPFVACWAALARWPIRTVLINVWLPVVLLLPQYYILRFPHLPPLTFADAAVLPLGIALFVKRMRGWRLDWTDLWVVLLALSAGLSESLSTALAKGNWTSVFSVENTQVTTNWANGGLELFQAICTMVLPYMLGKLLIEPQPPEELSARKPVVRRFVVLLAIVACVSVVDFISGRSIWQAFFRHIFPDQPSQWPMQVRWGFGRIAGPFAHAILAGMIFLMGLIYCLWLRIFAPRWASRRILSGVPLTMRGVILWAIIAGLFMTQSRGPWIGVGLALVLAFLVRTFSFGKAILAFAAVLAVFSAGAYYYGDRYTNVDISHAKTEEQRNAIYRRELLNAYIPIVKERKAFGWGITTLPTINGQKSVDNQYLLLAAQQGLTGLALFLLILLSSGVRLFKLASGPLPNEDRALVFAHLTILLGLVVALTTVYLGEQALVLLFFMIGWIHGMRPAGVQLGMRQEVQDLRFRRVLA